MDKNPQAAASAFKRCRGKLLKIKELGITANMSVKKQEAMIENLATAKAVEANMDMNEFVAGQRWYVEGLVKFAGMTVEEQFEAEYQDSFADSASEAEMLTALKALAA